ncbi:co-chaperone YbbN [Streptomyces sp. SAJ15]|uniref:thioredoxin family protein n=1 Tax=Streptomyces sp. SAJ15 TaxID=2011095 RepID=UPI0011869177|nr:thioredoxin domain-containing protein [Streptomyces sp. SAJ15]TVL91286.1 thiol reductase thioredoxin [Streptomyces sp. SAJ15]
MTQRSEVVGCPACGRRNRVPAAGDGRPRCGACGAPLPWIAHATDDDSAEVAEQAPPYVLVDLWAAWCGPCRMASPAVEQLATEMAGRIELVKIDIDRSPQLSARFAIQAVHTLLILDRGKVVARTTGAAPAPALRAWVEQAIRTSRSTTDA